VRQYAWYSPELNVIALQSIMEDCHIMFEWDSGDMYYAQLALGIGSDPMDEVLWIALGEL
jgi:hypothetical protein